MKRNFKKAIELVLKHEGGYVDHPSDPGGATNLGITRATLAAYRGLSVGELPKSDVKRLTRHEAEAIYKKNYWDKVSGDELANGVDYAVMDYAVNSGVSRSAKALQGIVGAKVDGVIGVMTLRAANEYDDQQLIERLCDGRLSFLQRLRHWKTFGKGWRRRVVGVKAKAVDMIDDDPVVPELEPDRSSSCEANCQTFTNNKLNDDHDALMQAGEALEKLRAEQVGLGEV